MRVITYLLGVVPVLGFFVGIFFANRVTPYVLGMPFVMFWIAGWVALTSLIMLVIYTLDPTNRKEEGK
jgi:uncharacterized membrane protein